MRQKFGGSAGLNSSGGVLQGIGSDPSYQPGSGGGSGSNSNTTFPVELPPIDVNQIAEASQKAFSFFSSSLSLLGEQVVKVSANDSLLLLYLVTRFILLFFFW
jgi:hypothetical protein